MLLLASVPPLLGYLARRRWRMPRTQAFVTFWVYFALVAAIAPDLTTLATKRYALWTWMCYSGIVLVVATFATFAGDISRWRRKGVRPSSQAPLEETPKWDSSD